MTNQNEINKTDCFYCYSAKLRKFIDINGIHWIGKGVNKNTNKPYWIFSRSNKLNELIEKYKELNTN